MDIRGLWAAAPLLLLGLVLYIVPQFAPMLGGSACRGWVFLIALAILTGELMLLGYLINGRVAGVIIDNRNLMSLSKLQAAAWTVVVLSALAAAAAFNAVGPSHDYSTVQALGVKIPGELLLAMGLSATSLVATPALLSLRAGEPPAEGAVEKAQARTGKPVVANGKLLNRPEPKDASWMDLLTGEEIGNAGMPDLGKIQQALVSLILIAVYAGYVFQYFVGVNGTVTQLPAVDKSFVWLLGVSHGTYLAFKATPHTRDPTSTHSAAG